MALMCVELPSFGSSTPSFDAVTRPVWVHRGQNVDARFSQKSRHVSITLVALCMRQMIDEMQQYFFGYYLVPVHVSYVLELRFE